jgi:hypothetical protein
VGKAFIMTPSTWGLVLFAPQIVVWRQTARQVISLWENQLVQAQR